MSALNYCHILRVAVPRKASNNDWPEQVGVEIIVSALFGRYSARMWPWNCILPSGQISGYYLS
jgi:hypothetical protein